ncbi:MAG TPA: DUF1156 domain-containing protein, partial [Acidobacteriota bacterium]|nr:DUF1156 domain-containing protein [Acidobacteriota bacterium]
EHAFPLKQASLDSVHEKNVRHGHISTLHIWPARRPLAACRAALIATLLPDPGTPEKRKELCEKIGGKIVKRIEKKKMPNGETVEREKEETKGGILHWGRETENSKDLDWFRQEIKKAYGGRAPKVLDPFAGGGAIPLEAMRLGCEATAVDINPVAWFILKCTLEYPQKLAGKTHPLPDFILEDEEFMEEFYKAHSHLVGRTKPTKKQLKDDENTLPGMSTHSEENNRIPKADLAWHVRAWGRWVLNHARKELAQYYPTYADYEPMDKNSTKAYEKRAMQLVPLKDDGNPDIDSLNKEFSKEYLADKTNPRWIAKPTVAYLWARTVKCKNCRATLPLLKTRWLCKKDKKRVLLAMEPNKEKNGVIFSIEPNVPAKGGNAAQKREHDKRIGAGTMSRSGAKCPCCGTIMTMEDIRLEGKAGRLSQVMFTIVYAKEKGKDFRLPTNEEINTAQISMTELSDLYNLIPSGLPQDNIIEDAKRSTWCVQYGFDEFGKLFTSRQLLALGNLVILLKKLPSLIHEHGYADEWVESITGYETCSLSRLLDYANCGAQWKLDANTINHSFVRNGIPISWDYAEGNIIGDSAGAFSLCYERICTALDVFGMHGDIALPPSIFRQSSKKLPDAKYEIILTDPPYYDAISYAAMMDFFYVWLRRLLFGINKEYSLVYEPPLCPKWSEEENDGELIDDANRFDGDRVKSKAAYENGMTDVFLRCRNALDDNGRFVIVFANKQPDAWETMVAAIIKSGFVVNGSWPIQTEQPSRMRAISSSALASSVWIVCKKRPEDARPGWDNQVLEEMRQNIKERLREYWDAGIRGPDFVWAATGPAMEAYSRHPIVKKANEPGPMTVNEFLIHVRRMVVDFVVGRVLSGDHEDSSDSASADRLDEPTAYYLLHRHDFGMDEAPAGACILYAISCGISDRELANTWDLIGFTKGKDSDEDEEADADADSDVEEDSGSKIKLKTWAQRKGKSIGFDAPGGKPIPLIDRVHCLMHLWKAGDLSKVDGYLDGNGLRRQELFKRLLQSIIELSPHNSEERSLLESLSNHIGAKGVVKDQAPILPLAESSETDEEE